jgi:hypothetical protein
MWLVTMMHGGNLKLTDTYILFSISHTFFPEDGRSRLKRVGMDVWMNRVLLKPVCKACGIYFNVVNYMVYWTLLGPMFTLHTTVVPSEIKRSAHNGFGYFMWFPETLFSNTPLIFFIAWAERVYCAVRTVLLNMHQINFLL